MDEFQDAQRPPQNAPRYLPRVWKAEPEPEPDPPAKKSKKKSADGAEQPGKGRREGSAKSGKSKSRRGNDDEAASKGALIEETPALDTYEARKRARMITGAVIAGIAVLFVMVIYWAVTGIKDEESRADEELLARAPSLNPAQAEGEARFMFNRARDVVKRGNVKLTVAFLQKISSAYPLTSAAQEAGTALALPREELPGYLDRASGVPAGPAPPKVVAGPASPAGAPKAASPPPRVASGASPNRTGPQLAAAPTGPRPPTGATPPGAPAPSGPAPPSTAEAMPAAPGAPAPPAATPVTATNEPSGKPLPPGFRRAPGIGLGNTGWPLQIVCERDGTTMVLVPGGNYRMGRDDGELSEGPAHRVVLGTYYVDQHEVTVRQFDLFQKQDGMRSERARALLKVQSSANDSEDAPVTMVTAREAKDYATWAGKRLPTEAQWEIAARSGDGRLFPWGNDDPQWEKPRAFRKTEPVRSHPRDVSPAGAFDMAGNAWEWTKDWFDVKYYNQFRNSVADNPTGPAKPKSEQLSVRGCSKSWTVTRREGIKWSSRLPYLGFRCVLPVEGPGNAFETPAVSGGGGPAPPGVAAPTTVAPF